MERISLAVVLNQNFQLVLEKDVEAW